MPRLESDFLVMESPGTCDGGSERPDRAARPEPGQDAPPAERISISGLDQQSAEALRIAVTRLAKRFGLEVRAEVREEPSPE